MRGSKSLWLAVILLSIEAWSAPASEWIVKLEEPTGIYRRDREVVTVKMRFQPGEARAGRLRVLGPDAKEIPCQIAAVSNHADGSLRDAELLFPGSILPGDRPEYRLVAGAPMQPPAMPSIVARRIGVGRLEMANDRFGIILNLGLERTEPTIVSAFNKTAGENRMLNLIDTSPDVRATLPAGKEAAGIGTFAAGLARSGSFEQVQILEEGPLRGRVVVRGARIGSAVETWEFVWHAGSPVLRWRARLEGGSPGPSYGIFFSSLSATPYEPFDRWIDGSEERFPDGWETDNPPDQVVGGKDMPDLPGGHVIYYRRGENYGAMGIYELDRALEWKGVGAAQLYASKKAAGADVATELALAFPRWKGTETVLEGRMEYRRFIQPILSVVRSAGSPGRSAPSPAPGAPPVVTIRPAAELKTQADEQVPQLDLRGPWKLQWAEKAEGEKQEFYRPGLDDSGWRTVQVPGTVHTQILQAPQYYSPEADWISAKEWWYRKTFAVPEGMRGRRLRLQFDATDYYTDIWLNGSFLGRHEGYTDPYEFDITRRTRLDGENHLAVRVWTPVSYYWRHRPYTVKGSYGAVDQKPDNITALGITRPVRLLGGGPGAIRDLAVDTRLRPDGSADVVVDLEIDGGAGRALDLAMTLAPRNFVGTTVLEMKARIEAGAPRRFVLHVDRPELWWTWDHGRPNLYTLDIAVRSRGELSDRRTLAVGIREIEHNDWRFYLNGRRFFVRGTNSYYNLFLSEMRRANYERDIGLMKAMNLNMIRLHCHFSNPEFYDLADELGILIWQDYLEAWYPEDTAFSLKAAGLYDPLIRYVRNHPSVAIWATSDEESLENYRDLTKHLEPRLYALDPQRRPVVRSTGRYGDGHIYHGWYGGSIWQYTSMKERFVSELGATALPNYDSVMKFLPDAWPIRDHAARWIFHKLQIPEAMRAWGDPGNLSLREYIPRTQNYVARLFQLAIERMRRLKYDPAGGILHFHAIDIWPSVTMAALDFWREPTKAYGTVQRSFQMVLPSIAYDRDSWEKGEPVKCELWLINDHWFAVPDLSLTWRLERAGEVLQSGAHPARVTLEPDSARRLTDLSVTPPASGEYILRASLQDAGGKLVSENIYEFSVW